MQENTPQLKSFEKPKVSHLRNGGVISQKQFTELVLQQNNISSMTLLTMAYMTPREDEGAVGEIHRHILHLASQGTSIHIGVDYNYALHVAPHSDFPNMVAPFFMDRDVLKQEQFKKAQLYRELQEHPNIELVFHGKKEGLIPYTKFDHRKVLQVKGSKNQDFAVIYGFNMDETLMHDVDSGIYITDPEALEWVDKQKDHKHNSQPVNAFFDNFEFITRETVKKGDRLADARISDVVQNAQSSILFCGQFMPEGVLFKDLVDAVERKVDVTIVSNNSSRSRQPLYLPARFIAERRLQSHFGNHPNFHLLTPESSNVFIHMKALIVDIDNPKKARAVTGTDNMASPTFRLTKSREILVELLRYDHMTNLYGYIAANVLPDVKNV